MNMSKLKPAIMRRTSICTAVGIAVTMGMVLMPFLVKPVMADDEAAVCDTETVAAPEGSSAEYTYKLDSNCTLHIGPVSLPSRDVDGIEIYPIQQHDKVRRIVFDKPEQTSLNVNSSYLFYGYPKVESIEGIDKLDVSHVMQFENAFAGLNLKEPVDLSSWNISKAYNFQSMFERSNLEGFKGLGKFTFDLNDKVQPYSRNFQLMFKDATSTEGIDLSGWTFLHPQESNGVLFNSIFENAKTPKIDVSSFSDLDIGNGATGMFANTSTDIEGLDRFPAQYMTDSNRMFENAKPTNHIDLSSWDTEKLNNASYMFSGSDIDKFSGIDEWNLDSLASANLMYANLNPSHQVWIQTNFPSLVSGMGMFAYSNLDMFPDIDKLQLSDQRFSPEGLSRMFENSKATYVKMSNWKNGKYFIERMLASPNIKYTTFGNKTVGDDPDSDFVLREASYLFEGVIDASDPGYQMTNVWDRPDLPKEYSAKKWATLPIKPECDAKFDGNPDNLPKDCWDDSQSWVSDKTGKEADEELLDNTTKHYQRIFFRLETIPVNFNANSVENIQNLPNSYSFDRLYKNNEGLIPNNTPVDSSGAREFLSWNTQADGKGKTYHPGDQVGHDVKSLDLYAQWKDKAPTIQFNNNGGEGTTPETKPTENDNTNIAVDCANTPSKNDTTFIGWSKTKSPVLEGPDAGDKGKIDVCGYSDKKTVKGLAGRTIDLYATWARQPQAFFKENRPKDMTALLPATKTITGNWAVDDSTPRTYVAPNIEGWNKGYSPDGVYRFDGWVNEDGSPFTGAYLERNDIIINAKWSRIAPAENHNHDNDNNDQNNHDNGNTNDNSGNTTDDSNTNHENNKETANNGNSDSDTTNSQQKNNAVNKPGTIPVTNNSNNQLNDSSSLFDPTPESPLNDSGESSNGSGSGYVASSNTDSPSSQSADSDNASSGHNLAETGASIIAPIVLIIVSIASATAAMVFSRMRNRRQQ